MYLIILTVFFLRPFTIVFHSLSEALHSDALLDSSSKAQSFIRAALKSARLSGVSHGPIRAGDHSPMNCGHFVDYKADIKIYNNVGNSRKNAKIVKYLHLPKFHYRKLRLPDVLHSELLEQVQQFLVGIFQAPCRIRNPFSKTK